METCHLHLSNTSTYFLASPLAEVWDTANGISHVTTHVDVFAQFFEGKCLSNIEAMFCHASFRECQMVEEEAWLPSLICRSECEKLYATWEGCLLQLESDPGLKTAFDDALKTLVGCQSPPLCSEHSLFRHTIFAPPLNFSTSQLLNSSTIIPYLVFSICHSCLLAGTNLMHEVFKSSDTINTNVFRTPV